MTTSEIEQKLRSIGLSKNEVKVYIDLIKRGKSSAGDISKRAQIHRANVYDTIDKLMKKGLIYQSVEKDRKVFYPSDAKNILSYLQQKEYDIKKIIPQIDSIHNKPIEERRVWTAEGIHSIRTILGDLLDLNEQICVYGIPKEAIEKLGGFIIDFHKKRINKKIIMKHVYNKNAEERINKLNKMDFTEARCLPSLYDSNISTLICGNKVLLIFWEKSYYVIVIENESIVKAYQSYFEILWQKAKV